MTLPSLDFLNVKVVAISVVNSERASQFCGNTLGLAPAYEGNQQIGYLLGETILMLKTDSDQPPTATPNSRVTLQVSAQAKPITNWAKEYWDALHPYSAGGAYVNFMMEEGQNRVKDSYRDNYQRLTEIKAKYDPTNLFRVNQNIQPAG